MSRSVEQERAKHAWDSVAEVKKPGGKDIRKDYRSLARGAASDIQVNGLGQTLAFWRSKGDGEHSVLYRHVDAWLRKSGVCGTDVLKWIVEDASTSEYRRATVEAMAYLAWLKRFAEAELPKEKSDGTATSN